MAAGTLKITQDMGPPQPGPLEQMVMNESPFKKTPYQYKQCLRQVSANLAVPINEKVFSKSKTRINTVEKSD